MFLQPQTTLWLRVAALHLMLFATLSSTVSSPFTVNGTDYFIENEGVTIYYRRYGSDDNPILIFQHGFPDREDTWTSQVESFQDRYSVITPKLRGYPPSGVPPLKSDYSAEKYISDMKAILDHVGAKTAILAGHDVGGFIVQRFALANPGLLSGLIMINTPIIPTFLPLIEFDAGQQNLSTYTLKYFAYEPSQPKNLSLITRNIRNQIYRRSIQQYMAENPIFGMLDFYNENYPAPPYEQPVDSLFNITGLQYEMPSMILWGTEDPYFSAKTIDGLEPWFAKGVRVVTVPGAGHWVFRDNVTKSNLEIGSFLDTLPKLDALK